ncbi:MAG: hypothetical protein HZC28_06690 [Spirochaetes bacterium]|nr:hypothetical protein [Spirochaetota bacterium]
MSNGKYRNGSARLAGYDYSQPGAYFVTICTGQRMPYFGEIVDGKMIPSDIGSVTRDEWHKTPAIRPDMNITLDAFVLMPDHIHGIIIIGENSYNNVAVGIGRRATHRAPTDTHGVAVNSFSPQSKNLASIIRGFKSAVTQFARIHAIEFCWQPRFYDHIIRDDDECNRVRQYIEDNPRRWCERMGTQDGDGYIRYGIEDQIKL